MLPTITLISANDIRAISW